MPGRQRAQAFTNRTTTKPAIAVATGAKKASPGRVLQGQYSRRLRKLKGADRAKVQVADKLVR